MNRDPALTVYSIDLSLKRARTEGWPAIEIRLASHLYKDLLTLKGLTWWTTDSSYSAKHEDRPLKVYRGHPLILNELGNPQSTVSSRLLDGSYTGVTILYLPDWNGPGSPGFNPYPKNQPED